MSFGLPAVKVTPERAAPRAPIEGTYGVPSVLTAGISSVHAQLGAAHPLEFSERNYQLNQDRMSMQMLRNIQGLHAPLKLTMELNAASKVGRLPFLASSNLQRDVVTGHYPNVDFEDILNTPEFMEVGGQPHAIVEKSLRIL